MLRRGDRDRQRTANAVAVAVGLAAVAGPRLVPAQAQPAFADGATVAWSVAPIAAAGPGKRVTLVLHAAIKPGWHVYALNQAPNGPTPLVIALEANDWAVGAGRPGASRPVVGHDPAFGLDTPFYVQPFEVSVPVRLKAGLASGAYAIPVSVRFQTCSGQTCQPPRTVHLTAPVTIKAAS